MLLATRDNTPSVSSASRQHAILRYNSIHTYNDFADSLINFPKRVGTIKDRMGGKGTLSATEYKTGTLRTEIKDWKMLDQKMRSRLCSN